MCFLSLSPSLPPSLSLVRDACSRLPNGEGTRLDVRRIKTCQMFTIEHISWAYDAANRYRKIITARPKTTPVRQYGTQ